MNEINWGNIWKKRIDRNVKQKAVLMWEEAMEDKPTLRWYKNKTKPGREVVYDGSWGGELFFRARTDSLEINGRNYH